MSETIDINLSKTLFRNHLGFKEVKAGIVPLRFTEAQLAIYAETDAYAKRSLCLSGICLDFLTDSSFLRFTYAVREIVRNNLYFDLFVDGNWVDSQGEGPVRNERNEFYYEIPNASDGKMRRITVYLPQNVEIALTNFKLSSEAKIEEAPTASRNLLCLGDSITQGMDAVHPASTYPVLLSRALNMNLLNQGVGGYYFEADSLQGGIPYQPDLITIAYGTNDWSRFETLAEFRHHCANYISAVTALYPGTRMLVLTPIWRKDHDEQRAIGAFHLIEDTIRDVCSDFSETEVIDGMELVPHRSAFFGDGKVHPNDEGFVHYAMNLMRYILSSQ